MSSAVDIQIVSPPNLDKIESFFKDASYRETIEYSANFNTRLCIERRLRLPFIDPQTGVAQNHSQLFVDKSHRMPGFRQGQIYTYPAARWRKSRRQYLNKMYRFPERPFQALRKEQDAHVAGVGSSSTNFIGNGGTSSSSPTVGSAGTLHPDPDFNGTLLEDTSSMGAAGGDTSDSKDSQQQHQSQHHSQSSSSSSHLHLKEELPKEWFYDDIDINDGDSLEEPKSPADDEYDYDPRYGAKKRRKRRAGGGKRASLTPGETPVRRPRASGGGGSGTGTRGRRRTKAQPSANASANALNPPSPGLNSEPPSFESAAAAVGVAAAVAATGDMNAVGSSISGIVEEHGDLRNYLPTAAPVSTLPGNINFVESFKI